MYYLYTIDCPACRVLEKKLAQKNIEYMRVTDEIAFKKKKITTFPVMQINGGPLMSYKEAVDHINSL